jgi:predicted LPLAT superfamily acyltransferase
MKQQTGRILVVVPVFNNLKTVAGLVRDVLALGVPVLVVNDGSTDGSSRVIDDLAVPHIDVPRNRGKGRAIRSALAWANERNYSHIITIDADGQHAARDIPPFIERIKEAPDKIIIGRRTFSHDAPGRSRFGRRWSNMWIRAASGARTSDSQSGFRAYPVVPLVHMKFFGSRYEFEVEVLVRAVWAGLGLAEVDVSVQYFSGGERVSHFRMGRDNARISLMYTALVFRHWLPIPHRKLVRPNAKEGPTAPNYGNRAGYAVFRWTIKHLGLGPAYGVLVPVIAYYVFCRPSASRAAVFYLERRFAGCGWFRKMGLTYLHYYRFGQCLIDQAAVQITGPKSLAIDFPEADQLKKLVQEGRGLVLVSSHVGVWQSAISTLGYLERSVYLQVRREQHSQWMGLANYPNSGIDLHIVSPDGFLGGVPELSLALARGNIVAVMGDRGYGTAVQQTAVFLGDKASFPILPYHLAVTTKSDVVVFLTSRIGPRRFQIRAEIQRWTGEGPGLGKTQACSHLLERYVEALEEHLRRFPFMWFNFIDIWTAAGGIGREPDRR